jgi:hypothetical protein
MLAVIVQADGARYDLPNRFPGGRVLRHGEEPVIQFFGTIRTFPTTHRAAEALTVRNQRELPSCLRFSKVFREFCKSEGYPWESMRHVNPLFAEWIMGLPRNWTSPVPRDSPFPPAVKAWPVRTSRWQTLSLFSGVGGLDLGLSPWCEAQAYVECSAAAVAVLEARMRDGGLERRPILPDVRSIRACELRFVLDGIIAGFPLARAPVQLARCRA